MILLHILSNNKNQALEISQLLLKKKLVVNTVFSENLTLCTRGDDDEIIEENQYMILAKTKALLFTKIDELLREKYAKKLPTIFSVPIVHMDWDQTQDLVLNTTTV